MTRIAKSLTRRGLATTFCLQSAMAAAQPPRQVLPEGIRGGSEVVPEAKVEIRKCMGHSQGGGGARHLAEKYPDTWAAVALLAPALFNVQVTAESAITKVPLLLAVGDRDSLITSSRAFSEQLKGLKVEHAYIEKAGLDHGTIIMGAMPDVFRFFPKHVKADRRAEPQRSGR